MILSQHLFLRKFQQFENINRVAMVKVNLLNPRSLLLTTDLLQYFSLRSENDKRSLPFKHYLKYLVIIALFNLPVFNP